MKEKLAPFIARYFSMKDIRRTFSLLRPFIWEQKFAYLILLIFLVVDIFLTIAYARFYGTITDSALHGGFREILALIPFGIFLLMLSILSNVSQIYFDTIAINGVKKELKNYLYHHILRLPAGETSNLRSGELMAHFSNDIHGVDGVIGSSLINLIRMPLIYVSVFVYLAQINLTLCFVSVLIAPIAAASGAVFGLLLRNNGRQIHHLVGDIHQHLNETFHGFGVIRSFALETLFYKKYSKKNQHLFLLELENSKLQSLYYSGGQIIGTISYLISLSIGAMYVSDRILTVGALLTFLNLMNHLVHPLTGIAGQWAGFQRSVAALERVLNMLGKPADLVELPHPTSTISLRNNIQFNAVTFQYSENQPVLENFNVTIPAGKIVALVGPSGAGKSTLFNLIQGFYQPISGSIFFDGMPLKEYDPSVIRSSIGHVPQETFLFSGTVKENLMLARPGVTEEEIIHAGKGANIHDFIMSLSEGYDTEIGERGIKLSGGQKQRLAIARAMLKDAPILLLDEATSSLDNETEFHVREELDHLMEGKTTIVIAHRLTTVQNADIILVMNKGKIVQIGTHSDLLAKKGLYQKLYKSEFASKQRMQRSLAVGSDF